MLSIEQKDSLFFNHTKFKNKQMQLSGTKEDMVAEFKTLMDKFDERIASLAQYARNQQANPSNTSTDELNKLKLERAKVKGISIDMETMTEGQVLDLKKRYDEDYRAAYQLLEKPSEART